MRLFIAAVWLVANALPTPVALWVADRLGDAVLALVKVHPRFSQSLPRTIRLALGSALPPREVNRLARVHARQIFETIFEVCQMRRLATAAGGDSPPQRRRQRHSSLPRGLCGGLYDGPIARLDGLEHFKAAHQKGRGVVLVGAHLGNWELLIAGLPLWVSAPVATIVLRQADPVSNAFLQQQRRLFGTKIIYSHGNPTPMALQWLRNGGTLLLLADQHGESRRNIVPFFGRDVSVPGGPVAFAQRSGAPLVPVYTVRERPGRHIVVFEPELALVRTDDPGADFKENCRRYIARFEKWILAHPEQWLWSYERWAWLDRG